MVPKQNKIKQTRNESSEAVTYLRSCLVCQLPIMPCNICPSEMNGEDMVGVCLKAKVGPRRSACKAMQLPHVSGERDCMRTLGSMEHAGRNKRQAGELLNIFRLATLVQCHPRGVSSASSRVLITYPCPFPDDCLHCGDFLSVFLVSDFPWLLKSLWLCVLTHPDAPQNG